MKKAHQISFWATDRVQEQIYFLRKHYEENTSELVRRLIDAEFIKLNNKNLTEFSQGQILI